MDSCNFPYKIIFFTGVDGSGKTFFSQQVINILKSQGLPAVHVWSRFNNITSKPLLAFCRVTGLNYYEEINGVRIGYHDFEKSQVIGWLFVFFQLIDIWLVTIFRTWPRLIRGDIIICDRGIYDTLVDVMVDTKNEQLYNSRIAKAFFVLLPRHHLTILIRRDSEKIFSSRPDVKIDRNFHLRCLLYERCAEKFNWAVVNNNSTIQEALEGLIKILLTEDSGPKKLEIGNTEMVQSTTGRWIIKKKTVNVRSPFIRYFLQNKAGVMISNWVFQGTLYMENTERMFKALFGCIFFMAYFLLWSLTGVAIYTRVVLAFCLSHTTNWIFNGHLFVLGRYLGFTRSEARAFIEYPREIKIRLVQKKSIDAVAFFGSLSRGSFSSSSDLDIRIIPRHGIANGLIASFWAFVERTRALFHRYPLDLYVIRTPASLQKINRNEYPIVLFDRGGFFSKHYTNFFIYEDFLVRFIEQYVEKK